VDPRTGVDHRTGVDAFAEDKTFFTLARNRSTIVLSSSPWTRLCTDYTLLSPVHTFLSFGQCASIDMDTVHRLELLGTKSFRVFRNAESKRSNRLDSVYNTCSGSTLVSLWVNEC
jgi:hypothetical protein